MEPATALLIDDDPTTVDVLRMALAGERMAFDVAYDFATAVRCLDSGRYCGVIVDLAVSRGHELLRQISLPTVVIANGKIPEALREHVRFVLPKPVKMALLLNVIRGFYALASANQVPEPRRNRRAAAPEELRDADLLRDRL